MWTVLNIIAGLVDIGIFYFSEYFSIIGKYWQFSISDFHIHSGTGAGFYLNATQEKWKNWRMYDYVVKELPKLLSDNFPHLETSKASIFGHSMGGHGALTIYLKNQDKYKV